MKIGMFDSGMGGLSLLHKALKMLPGEDYIFYADIKRVPYGTKTNEEIKAYAMEAAEFLEGQGCSAVVVACNTATSIAIKALREKFSFPIIGVEPAVKPAVTHAGHKRVLVMATPVTVREAKLHLLISSLNAENEVDLLAMPGLVEFAEAENFDSKEVCSYIKESLGERDLQQYSDLVLGCTHFNYFKDALASIFPKTTQITDGSEGTVRHLAAVLGGKAKSGAGKVEYYITGGEKAPEECLGKIERLLCRLDDMNEITCGEN